jgi:hypothetical protein
MIAAQLLIFCCAMGMASGTVGASTPSMDGSVFFFTSVCPDGWAEFSALSGRLSLLVNNSFQSGASYGFPLSDGEDRAHTHLVSGSLSLPHKEISALGGLNEDAAASGQQPLLPFANISLPASSGFPLVQLTACRYSSLSFKPAPVLPSGGVALWDVAAPASCPTGFAPLTAGGDGRLLVLGGENNTAVAMSSGAPAQPGADVSSHVHAFSSSIDLGATDFVGIAGCCDDSLAADGTVNFSGETSPGSSSMPYAAVLACNASVSGGATTFLPSGGILILAAPGATCPPGWTPLSANISGRFPVGTPPHGVPARAWGGVPLSGDVSAWIPSHSHAWSAAVNLNPAGIALDSGCCAHNYGKAATYAASGDTANPLPADFPPFILLPACEQL